MKRVKIVFAIGLQLAMVASIGSFVGWPFMMPVLYIALSFILLSIILFIVEMSKD